MIRAEAGSPKLLQQVRRAVRVRHYSPRTEESYVAWVRRYVRFHGLRHPGELGVQEITRLHHDLAGRLERLTTGSAPVFQHATFCVGRCLTR